MVLIAFRPDQIFVLRDGRTLTPLGRAVTVVTGAGSDAEVNAVVTQRLRARLTCRRQYQGECGGLAEPERHYSCDPSQHPISCSLTRPRVSASREPRSPV